jgi:hypothetical protein
MGYSYEKNKYGYGDLSLMDFIFQQRMQGIKKDSSDLLHRITYTRKGSRSEARHGHLKVNNREIPDLFSLVAQGDRAFRFFQRKNLWRDDGYFPTRMPVIDKSGSEITH